MLRQALTVRFARLIRLPVATVAAPPRLLLLLPGLPGLSRSFSLRFSSSSLQAAAAGVAGEGPGTDSAIDGREGKHGI